MFAVSNLAFITELEPEPKTWRDAMRTKDRDDWVASGKSEFESQASNGTWGNLMAVQELKRSDPGVRIIAAGDVLKAKRDGRKKTRTVLRGYMMEPGIHFNETFAPHAGGAHHHATRADSTWHQARLGDEARRCAYGLPAKRYRY